MKLFSQLRKELDLDICLFVRSELPQIRFVDDGTLRFNVWDRFFIESKLTDDAGRRHRFGIHVQSKYRDETTGQLDMRGLVYGEDRHGKPALLSEIDIAGLAADPDAEPSERSMAFYVLRVITFLLSLDDEAKGETMELARETTRTWGRDRKGREMPIEVHERREDTVIFRKLSRRDIADRVRQPRDEQHVAESRPSTPRREHSVRGHWRTYKSGKRVWVRGHHRGTDAHRVVKILEV